jgi:hypothetical protein
MILEPLFPMIAGHFSGIDRPTVQKTINESEINFRDDLGGFTVHHGHRFGAPIVIVENHSHEADSLSAVWYDEAMPGTAP